MYEGIALINNDKYGASELKKLYQGYTLKGFIIAVTIHIALIAAYMVFAYINESKAKDIPKNTKEVINFVEIDTPPSLDEIPPVKEEEIIKQVKDLSALTPQPVKKDIADDIKLKTQDELNNMNTNVSREGDSLIASTNTGKIDDKIDVKIKEVKDPVKDIYNSYEVEKAPECINLSQVKASMKYPDLAVETGMEGRVTVKVLVGPDGNVIKLGTISGPEIFYDEVKEKSKDLQFTAGLQNNTPVKVTGNSSF
jgi:outer membrane biosynthesis protein TonB